MLREYDIKALGKAFTSQTAILIWNIGDGAIK